jgi:beta-aspartyl-dipeptidase (metallo-type)
MALRIMLEEGIPVGHITFSSDGQASLPFFNIHGEYAGLQVGKVSSLYHEVRDSVLEEGIPLETALKVITTNPHNLKLSNRAVFKSEDADIIVAKNIINRHCSGGKDVVEKGVPL